MTTATLQDWRLDPAVVAARSAHESAQTAVGQLETDLRRCALDLQAGEVALREAEIAGDLGTVATHRRRVIQTRAAIGKLETRAEAVYETAQTALQALHAAEATARRATWPGQLAEYRRLASELAWAIDAALEAEENLEGAHRDMCALFGGGAGGWIVSPDGRQIGNAGFGNRRLQRGPVEVWRRWVGEHVQDDPAVGARKLAQDLRQLAGR